MSSKISKSKSGSRAWKIWRDSGAVSGMPEAKTEKKEVLYFSQKQYLCQLDTTEKWVTGSTVDLIFYKGKQFTDRRSAGNPCPWEDAQIVAKGVINDNEITYETKDHYTEYYFARETVELQAKYERGDIDDDLDNMFDRLLNEEEIEQS